MSSERREKMDRESSVQCLEHRSRVEGDELEAVSGGVERWLVWNVHRSWLSFEVGFEGAVVSEGWENEGG